MEVEVGQVAQVIFWFGLDSGLAEMTAIKRYERHFRPEHAVNFYP
jgi:hypothetical protein